MEIISNFSGGDLKELKEKSLFPEDTDPYEEGEGFEVREDDGGKILKRRVDLAYEMGKQVEIFHSEEYQEARASAGNEFLQDSGWEMPTEDEGRIFGGNIKYTDKLVESLDIGIGLFFGDSSIGSKLRLLKNTISNGKLEMVENINQGFVGEAVSNLTKKDFFNFKLDMVKVDEERFEVKKVADENEGLAHGGMEFLKILPLRDFKIKNRNNSGVDLGLLPEFVKENRLKKIK